MLSEGPGWGSGLGVKGPGRLGLIPGVLVNALVMSIRDSQGSRTELRGAEQQGSPSPSSNPRPPPCSGPSEVAQEWQGSPQTTD